MKVKSGKLEVLKWKDESEKMKVKSGKLEVLKWKDESGKMKMKSGKLFEQILNNFELFPEKTDLHHPQPITKKIWIILSLRHVKPTRSAI